VRTLHRKTANLYANVGWNVIELRFCLQNISNCAVYLHPDTFASSLSFVTYNGEEEQSSSEHFNGLNHKIGEALFSVLESRIIGFNGLDFVGNRCVLGSLQFAVLSCHVRCSSEVRTEADFLTMLKFISFRLPIPTSSRREPSLEDSSGVKFLSVTIEVFDEDKIWDHYLMLPGGVVLLRDKPLTNIL
jgi:hypothetical protein